LTNREEYEEWSNKSIIEYQITIAPSSQQRDAILRRRFSYENNLPRELRSPSQAGLRVPAMTSVVEAIVDFSFLESKLWPGRVECRVGVPSTKGGFEERLSAGEPLGTSRALFFCGDRNLPAGSQLIVQWFWPELPKGGE
jgi:hypothetical protein